VSYIQGQTNLLLVACCSQMAFMVLTKFLVSDAWGRAFLRMMHDLLQAQNPRELAIFAYGR